VDRPGLVGRGEPSKPHTIASALVGVSCATPQSCMAVGNSRARAASPTVPLVERWNGSKWSAVPSPIPKGSTGTYLDAVSCASAKACIAVGNYTSSFTSGSALVVRWNGPKWALMRGRTRRSAVPLLGVSCTGAGPALTCWAVGQYATDANGSPYYTVTERLAHGKWTVVASPNGHGDHSAADVGLKLERRAASPQVRGTTATAPRSSSAGTAPGGPSKSANPRLHVQPVVGHLVRERAAASRRGRRDRHRAG
jgi:hypothetical protein